jgi:nucleoside 2-deoxyribosyltransferase
MVVKDDPFSGPEWERYRKHVEDELVPMVRDSAVTISLVPGGKPDVKFAVELGFMIMLDKPIIAVVGRNAKVPLKLAKVADEIVEGEISDPDFQERLHAAIDRIKAKL